MNPNNEAAVDAAALSIPFANAAIDTVKIP
jgi:hypothetical protein